MQFRPFIEREFETGHFLEGHPRCGNPEHGHRWSIRIVFEGNYDVAEGTSLDMAAVDAVMDSALVRLVDKPIHKVLSATMATPEGIALWFLDHFSTAFPEVRAVTVWQDAEHGYEVRQDPRP